MEAKKVKVEVVGVEPRKGSFKKFLAWLKKIFFRFKLGIAILLDIIDFFLGIIPIVNTLWDVVCFLILLVLLKNKRLAFLSLVELPLLGLPPFSIIDMFLPICTLVVLMDNSSGNVFVGKIK